MGVSPEFVAMMERHNVSGRGASLGYPHFVGRSDGKKVRTDSEPIWDRLGVKVDFFDVGPLEGKPIRILDLNQPLKLEFIHQYDFIINPGTFEHVWNAPNAMWAAHRMVRTGGLLFMHGRVGIADQGYWSQTKLTLKAFCDANGHELLEQTFSGNAYDAAVRKGRERVLQFPQENNVR